VVSAIQATNSAAGFRQGRIILTTFGSLGDLHPYIALALGLKARGHEAVIATSDFYRQKIEALGIQFRAVRPEHPDPASNPELMRRIMDRRTGSKFIIYDLMMSALRASYQDTLRAAEGADLLVVSVSEMVAVLAA
jgi:rhamnosyltransferase subunit B